MLEDTSDRYDDIIKLVNRRGNCRDNAAMESFFATLKIERLSKKRYRTRDELC